MIRANLPKIHFIETVQSHKDTVNLVLSFPKVIGRTLKSSSLLIWIDPSGDNPVNSVHQIGAALTSSIICKIQSKDYRIKGMRMEEGYWAVEFRQSIDHPLCKGHMTLRPPSGLAMPVVKGFFLDFADLCDEAIKEFIHFHGLPWTIWRVH